MKILTQRALITLLFPCLFLVIFYGVMGISQIEQLDLSHWGIYPREVRGLAGILTHPFVHAGWEHLYSNSLPFVLLTWALCYFYRDWGLLVFFLLWIGTGVLTFAIGQPGWHIGASGIIYALASFLFFSGIFRRHPPLIALSLLVIFLYGSLVWGLFPSPYTLQQNISWEGHLSGGFMGLLLAVAFRHKGPQRRNPFEEEEEGEEKEERTMDGEHHEDGITGATESGGTENGSTENGCAENGNGENGNGESGVTGIEYHYIPPFDRPSN